MERLGGVLAGAVAGILAAGAMLALLVSPEAQASVAMNATVGPLSGVLVFAIMAMLARQDMQLERVVKRQPFLPMSELSAMSRAMLTLNGVMLALSLFGVGYVASLVLLG